VAEKRFWDAAWFISRSLLGIFLDIFLLGGSFAAALEVFQALHANGQRAGALLLAFTTLGGCLAGRSWARAQYFAYVLPEIAAELNKIAKETK
jgi:hypothetical protein